MSDSHQQGPESETPARAATSSKPMVEWAFEPPSAPKGPQDPTPPPPNPPETPIAPKAAAAKSDDGKKQQPQQPKVRVRVLTGVATVVLVAGATVGTLEVTGGTPTAQKASEAAQSSQLTILGLPTYTSASPTPSAAKKATAKAAATKSVAKVASSSPAAAAADTSSGLTAAETAALAASSPTGQHVALIKNGSGSAYAFALSSAHTLVYAYQSSTGPGGWSNFATVPGSPTDLVSEPAAAVDKDGSVEVFARNAAGRIVDGSQTSSGFSWNDSAGGSLPDTPAGDPTTVLQPDGDISVFIRLADGHVAMASQKSPNGGGWTAWSSLGGDVSGDPVAYSDPDGLVDLFAVSGSGTLVADFEAYGAFIGWNTLSSSPEGLTDTPYPLANQNGQTEVFVTTSAGNMDSAWGTGGSDSWTWGAPLTGEDLGSAIASSPTGYAWGTDGHLEIFARLANGDLAHAWQNEPNGETDWSLWGTLPGSPSGYPTAYINGDGNPEVLMLSPYNEIEFDYWMSSSSAWSAPIVMPGDI
jgi:hypothetical protein